MTERVCRGRLVAGLVLGAMLASGDGATATAERGAWPRVFAHRGGAGEAPENTLAAFLGTHGRDPHAVLELDVRASRDGHLVVIHDATVDRTTNGSGRVADLTLAQLKALDAGYCATPGRGSGTGCAAMADPRAFPFRGKGVTIPTLREVLEALPSEAALSIELKEAGHERALADLLRGTADRRLLLLGSHDERIAEALVPLVRQALFYFPTYAAACIAGVVRGAGASETCARALGRYQVLAAPPSAFGVDVTSPAVIGPLRSRGISVVFFTINDGAEIARLFRAGADGVITDYPSRARRILETIEHRRGSPRR